MKTAISMDGELLHETDRAARELGLSRSRLISVALEDYLRHRRQKQMIEQLNRVYSKPDSTEARATKKMKAKFRSTIRDQW
jgi:metal-responsive CopG/Arc/MetJ family transcriptional regulator